jgi:hypothetical protein
VKGREGGREAGGRVFSKKEAASVCEMRRMEMEVHTDGFPAPRMMIT